MCASSSGPDCLQFLTDPDAASAQEAASSCAGYCWPTWPLLRGVRQLGTLSLRSLPVLAIGRATESHFWAARRQAPAHVLALCPATCSRFLPVYRKALTHFWCAFFLFQKFRSFPCLKINKQKVHKNLEIFFFKNYSSPWKAFFGGCLHTGVFTYSVVPTKVFQAEWLGNKLFIGW